MSEFEKSAIGSPSKNRLKLKKNTGKVHIEIMRHYLGYIDDAIKNYWNHPALTNYGGNTYTYGDIAAGIAKYHILFEKCSIDKGDKIALCGKNSAEWCIAYLAVLTYDAVAVPLLSDFLPKNVVELTKISDSRLIVVDDAIMTSFKKHKVADDFAEIENFGAIINVNGIKIMPESNNLPSNIEEDVAIIQVPTIFAKQQLSTAYNELLRTIFYNVTGSNFTLKIVDSYEVKEEVTHDNHDIDSFIDFNSNLNPNYTFETFVVGPSNREGQAASLAAALNPGRFYNPLFLFGKSGLGKTHLLHAVGNYIRSKNKSMRVLYISSDQFIEEYFRCIREKGFEALKNRFRSIDVILIDDIQFLASREKVGEYFFSIFNLFINSNKQIIMTSDRPPLELKGLEDRLVSRFASGLSVGLSAPEYETSLKILKNKKNRIFKTSFKKRSKRRNRRTTDRIRRSGI